MNLKEMMDDNPKSAELLREWLKVMIANSASEAADDFKMILDAFTVDNEAVYSIIKDNVRSLFDFFDVQDIFISIQRNYSDDTFSWSIEEINGHGYSFRKDAEEHAVNYAFKQLEAKL